MAENGFSSEDGSAVSRRALLKSLAGEARGAHFVRADLQVHTPDDGRFRFPGPVPTNDEERLELATSYLTRARERGIGLVAITEHDDVSWIPIMRAAAAEVGIALMPGFEVESGEGVHVLCLFDHDASMDDLERALAATLAPAVGRRARERGPVRLPFADLIDTVQDGHGGVCIAAHVHSEKGLRGALSGQARQRAWAHEGLLAVQVARAPRRDAGTERDDEDDSIDRRGRRPARVLTSDSRTLDDIGTVATQLKIDDASAAALRQAFLDPDSRIAYGDRPPPSGGAGARLLAVECDGGFLHEVRFGFGDQLTCVIGRSGTGKSALVEALRAGLGAGFTCERAEREAGALAAETLGGDAKLALAVEAGGERHLLEYSGGGTATVSGADGLAREGVDPAGLVGARVYGQGELAAIAADQRAQLALLDMAAGGGGSDAAGRRDAAERIDAALDGIVRINLHADDRIEIALNIALPERRRKYRPLERLSPGQRQAATLAVLLEVLGGGGGGGDGDAGGDDGSSGGDGGNGGRGNRDGNRGPVILDQPEDGLDARWICDTVIPRLRTIKRTRQLIVATHDPNIALLSGADQIVPLEKIQPDRGRYVHAIAAASGSIERPAVRQAAEDVLEGGRAARVLREATYGVG